MGMTHLTDETFDGFLHAARTPVVVAFHAPWCTDCRRIEPTLKALPERHPNLTFADVDTEEAMEVAARFDIRGIPTLLVFEGGRLVDRLYSREAKWPNEVEAFVEQVAGAAAGPERAQGAG
ncbi:MAG: thioredoxin family protein [Clostridia bacterium]|nr:thioredoxin family protein [Clostridia bacterium]